MYLIIYIIQVLIAVCIRVALYKFKELKNNIYTIYIEFSIFFVMMFILAYSVTDTYEGVVRIGLSLCFYGVMLYNNNEMNNSGLINIILFLVIPMYFLFLSDSVYYLLTSFITILIPVMLISNIMFVGYQEFNKKDWKRIVAFIIAIIFSMTFLPFVNESSKIEDIGEAFVNDELGYDVDYIFKDNGFRGEEIEVIAYDRSNGIDIKMIYKDNAIISYEVD